MYLKASTDVKNFFGEKWGEMRMWITKGTFKWHKCKLQMTG